MNGTDEVTEERSVPSLPVCRFVNVQLCGVEPAHGAKGYEATVLLENPQGEHQLDLERLTQEVREKYR